MLGQCRAELPRNHYAVLSLWKRAWHALLDLEKIPKEGKRGDGRAGAVKIAQARRVPAIVSRSDLAAVCFFLKDCYADAIIAARAVLKLATIENKRLHDAGAVGDRTGEGPKQLFLQLLEEERITILSVLALLIGGERSMSDTLLALPSDPTWPNARERKQTELKALKREQREEDEDGFLPTKRGPPCTGRIVPQ